MRTGIMTNVILMALLIAGCRSANVTGDWSGSWQTSDGTYAYAESITLQLVQHGAKVSGSGVDEHGSPAKVVGQITHKNVELTISNIDGSAKFVGTFERNKISGTWFAGDESGPWSVTRQGTHNK